MSASPLSLSLSRTRSRPGQTAPVAAGPTQVPHLLPEAPPQRSELPFIGLSLALHGLALLGAWLWSSAIPIIPPRIPPRPEPIILVNLPPMAPAPAPTVSGPQIPAPAPRPAAPRPAAKPVAKPTPAPQPRPAKLPARQKTPARAPASPPISPSDPSPAPQQDAAGPESTEKASAGASTAVSIDLHAAYRHNPAPRYPPLALRRGWQGTVRLRVTLDVQGRPTRVELAASSGHPLLDESALAAVRQWRFRPATRQGEAVAATVEVPIVFKLDR